MPYNLQVSALQEGLKKTLTLIATATGSGKTITKLMFAVTARLSGMRVVSVDASQNLVIDEYNDQKNVVSGLSGVNYDSTLDEKMKHNIVDIEHCFNSLGKLLDLSKLQKLVTDNGADNQEMKVDLDKQKITIGKKKLRSIRIIIR